uniref:Uncharacterized protein n=1 Tax=Gopherus agassizii TaxID=38772 RepID=A0A452I6E7_9SAUR
SPVSSKHLSFRIHVHAHGPMKEPPVDTLAGLRTRAEYKLAHRGYRKKKVVGDRYIKLSRRQGGSWSREWVWAPLLCPTD